MMFQLISAPNDKKSAPVGTSIRIFEILRAVRRFEDVLIDLIDDSPEINRLADVITEYLRV